MFHLCSVKHSTGYHRKTTRKFCCCFFFIYDYHPNHNNCLESEIPSTIQSNDNDSDLRKRGSCMVESRVSTGVLHISGSWFLLNPPRLSFIPGRSWFSLTIGMLWRYLKLLSPPRKPAFIGPILPFQEWHIEVLLDVHRGTAWCVIHWLSATENARMACPADGVAEITKYMVSDGNKFIIFFQCKKFISNSVISKNDALELHLFWVSSSESVVMCLKTLPQYCRASSRAYRITVQIAS